jgi:hypothetical protein
MKTCSIPSLVNECYSVKDGIALELIDTATQSRIEGWATGAAALGTKAGEHKNDGKKTNENINDNQAPCPRHRIP